MFKKEKSEKRFYIKETQSLGFGGVQIMVDRMTGVNYLMSVDLNAITPLLDENGKVVVDKLKNEEAKSW